MNQIFSIRPSEFKFPYQSKVQILITQFDEYNQDCAKISRPYHYYFPRNKLSKSVTAGSVWVECDQFIVLND